MPSQTPVQSQIESLLTNSRGYYDSRPQSIKITHQIANEYPFPEVQNLAVRACLTVYEQINATQREDDEIFNELKHHSSRLFKEIKAWINLKKVFSEPL